MDERELWAAVLFRAVQDATTSLRHVKAMEAQVRPDGRKNYPAMIRSAEVRQARAWFLKRGGDFTFVCHAAGFNPEIVAKCMERYRERDWRLPDKILALDASRFVNSPTRKARSSMTGPRAIRLSDPAETARPS